MAQHIDKLETSLGEFNENYVKVKKLIKKQLKKEPEDIPEIRQILGMMHSLDAVLDDLVTSVKLIDAKTNKS